VKPLNIPREYDSSEKLKKISRVLVTGVAGFMGSHLAERFISDGVEVVGIDNFSCGFMENLENLVKKKEFHLVKGDIRKIADLQRSMKEVEGVLHFAAQSSVPKSAENPLEDFEVNVRGTLNVLECARKLDVGVVIFASSSTVYGVTEVLPTDENQPILPISNYGASKAAAEAFCASYSALYDIKTANLRYYNIYGPRSRRGVMFDLLEKLRKNWRELEVLGDGKQTKDYLYISDAVDATMLIIEKGRLKGEAYNVGYGRNFSVSEIVEEILKITGLAGKTKIRYTGKSWPGDVPVTLADISKLKSLGFRPKVSLGDGLRKFIDWYEKTYGCVGAK